MECFSSTANMFRFVLMRMAPTPFWRYPAIPNHGLDPSALTRVHATRTSCVLSNPLTAQI